MKKINFFDKVKLLLFIATFFLGGVMSAEEKIPQWASFFDDGEYTLFIKEVKNYFSDNNLNFRMLEESGEIIYIKDDKESQFFLFNLGQLCKNNSKLQYREIVKTHFDNFIKHENFEKNFSKKIDKFEEVKKYLGVRIYPEEIFESVKREDTIYKTFLSDSYIMLIWDFPTTVATVSAETIISWEKSTDELLDLGQNNIKKKYQFQWEKLDSPDSGIFFIGTEHFFAPNVGLYIEDYPEYLGEYGALISFPTRNLVLLCPIHDIKIVREINDLLIMTYMESERGPGTLSNKIYWYNNKDKEYINIPYEYKGEKLSVSPPDEFIDLLNGLAEKGAN